MKRLLVVLPILFFIGCDLSFEQKEGVKCDEAIDLAENILNTKLFPTFVDKDITPLKIDKDNIIEWDYKNGRYLCKAKVSGKILKKEKYFLYLLEPYGIYQNKNKVEGWIYYQTFVTINEMKKLKENKQSSYYVEIEKVSKIPVW